MTPARTLVFAVAAALAVGNLYWAQPLIEIIADAFSVSSSAAAALVTVTQIGYAIGVFLIVPLGDVLNRRRLIPAILILSSGALIAAALAPTYAVLLAALAAVGMTTVAAQDRLDFRPIGGRHQKRARTEVFSEEGGLSNPRPHVCEPEAVAA